MFLKSPSNCFRHFLSALLAVSVLLGSQPVPAQSDVDKLFEMPFDAFLNLEVVEGVSKTSQTKIETPMSVYVVNQDELLRWSPNSLFEMIGRTPGFSYYNTDNYGSFGVISRGLNQVWRFGFGFELMPIIDFGHWVFSPYMFKNVEVGRGPSGLTWGSLSEAGLFNFNLRDDLNGSETVVEVGNQGRKAIDYMYGNPIGKKGDNYFLGFHWEEQDWHTIENTTSQIPETNPHLRANGIDPSWFFIGKIKHNNIKLLAYKDYNKHPFAHKTIVFSDKNELFELLESENGHLSATMENYSLRGEYHFFEENDENDFYVYGEYYKKQWFIDGFGLDTQRRYSFGFSGNRSFFNDRLGINIGGEFYTREEITSPSFNSSHAIDSGIDWYRNSFYPQESEYRNAYIEASYAFNPYIKTLIGGRADYQYDVDKKLLLSGPRLSLIYTPQKNLSIRYVYSQNYRRPRANELYTLSGEPNPERIDVHELITTWQIPQKLSFETTLFHQEMSEQINAVPVTGITQFINGGGIISQGIEWAFKIFPTDDFLFYWNGHWHDNEIKESSRWLGQMIIPRTHDKRPLFAPEFSSLVGTEMAIGNWMKVNLALRSEYNIPYLDLSGKEKEKDIHFVDTTIQSKPFFNKRLDLALVCTNLLNEEGPVPAYGEHLRNARGDVNPDPFRIFLRTTVHF